MSDGNEPAKGWIEAKQTKTHDFEKEKDLVGVLVGIEAEVGPNDSMLYTIEKEDNSLISVWGSAVLNSRLKNFKVGTEVKICYLGKAKNPKSKRTYHNYKVYSRE